jgi:hypothetical protein
MKVKKVRKGRCDILVNNRLFQAYNPNTEDKNYPNRWFASEVTLDGITLIRADFLVDMDGFNKLADLKHYIKMETSEK